MRYLEIPHDHLEELLNAQKHGVNHVFERYRKKFDKQYR